MKDGNEMKFENNDLNVGLNFFRILLTLGVVLDHFWIRDNPDALIGIGIDRAIWHLRTLAVPAFMTMTFFFTAKHFWKVDWKWARKRFVRLYEPFVFWAVAYWLLKTMMSYFNPAYTTSFADLLWQLVLGSSHTLTMQFWFHADLIILTVLFFVAFKVVKGKMTNLILSLAAIGVGFAVQYSPMNAFLFSGLRFEMKYPLGRLFCMLPYAGVGFLLAAAKSRIDTISVLGRFIVVIVGIAIAWWFVYFPSLAMPAEIVGYEGVNLNLIAWGMMPAFYYLPFERLPALCSKVVMFISRYCMGVYCVHLAIGWLFYDYVLGLDKVPFSFGEMRSFSFCACLAVWVLSYVFCWMFAKIPVGLCRRVVE